METPGENERRATEAQQWGREWTPGTPATLAGANEAVDRQVRLAREASRKERSREWLRFRACSSGRRPVEES